MTTTVYHAWVTTAHAEPTIGPGVVITDAVVNDDGYHWDTGEQHAASDPSTLAADWGEDPDDPSRLDEHAADQELTRLGYRRVGDWVPSGSQWAVDVKPLAEPSNDHN